MGISGNILVIDDEATIRHTLPRILQRANIKATAVASGAEGLTLLAQQTFDLVYLDIRMPEMNGMEVLKVIHARFPELPVILFTAQPDINSALDALRQGAVDYLLKPLQPQALIDRTQSILEAREKERRKREVQSQIEVLQAELKKLESDQEPRVEPAGVAANSSERFLAFGKLSLDLQTHRLAVEGRSINLPPATFDYLLVLVRHAPNVVDYQTLVTEAQGYQVEAREAQELVKWHVHHIRQAIEPDARDPIYVINVRGIGYRLVEG
ncbi:MAG TPA: response regulator transcription factor [Anaerolineales bacterium]|nr:response regulator transcription factor [Anaerolineales bacterium]